MPFNSRFVNIECLTIALIRRLVGVDSHVNRDLLTIFYIVVYLMLFSMLSFIHTTKGTTTIRLTIVLMQYEVIDNMQAICACVVLHWMRLF